jgi:hypothetical protein
MILVFIGIEKCENFDFLTAMALFKITFLKFENS